MINVPPSSTISRFNGEQVHYIDGMPTVIHHVHGDIASGYTINNDLTTTECYIAKGHGLFAHGKTAREAANELERKIIGGMDTEGKVAEFIKKFDKDGTYPTRDFYDWHGILTGSCTFGRDSFARDHHVDLDGKMTTKEFLRLTKDAFGSDIIRSVIEKLGLHDEIK